MVGERIIALRKEVEMSQLKLAELLGIKAAAVSQFENGKTNPSIETLLRVADIFGASLHWLLKGEGEQYIATKNGEFNYVDSPVSFMSEEDTIELPVVGEISAGQPLPCHEDAGESVRINASELSGDPQNYICFRVNGDSMNPDIMHGDKVLIKKTSDWAYAEGKVCAVRVEGEITLKKLAFDKANQSIKLIPLNKEFHDLVLKPDEYSDILLIGVLVYLYRKYSK
ncbi:MAG: helix-turn-helix domain-containing protein [Candidatus Cloacimonetes bacterium]|nr:helix-turn-helix domain-containing protein [Candidatus Cloacimonadota bacterium]